MLPATRYASLRSAPKKPRVVYAHKRIGLAHCKKRAQLHESYGKMHSLEEDACLASWPTGDVSVLQLDSTHHAGRRVVDQGTSPR
jgi:hypothetical protein